MDLELTVGFVVIAFDGCFLDGAVHPLDLTIRPGMLDLSQSMFDTALPTRTAEDVLEGETVPSTIRELNAVVGQYSVKPVGNSFDEILQKLGRLQLPRLSMQFNKGKFAGAVDRNEQIQLPFGCLYLGNIDVEIADWIALELFLRGLAALDLRQTRDAMALKAAVQRRSRQERDCRLERKKAAIERQQRALPSLDDDCLVLRRKDGGFWIPGTCWKISD